MPLFRKKPIIVEAIQWTGDNYEEVCAFRGKKFARAGHDESILGIATSEGTMEATIGDWIIKEPFPTGDRKFYPCKPAIFEQTYEPVERDHD